MSDLVRIGRKLLASCPPGSAAALLGAPFSNAVRAAADAQAAENKMLAVAERYGWHTLTTASEYETAARLERQGLGDAVRGIGGHDGSFRIKRRRA